ncbi:hypothetical protein TNCV_4414101 [Trichonephila clavipes]|uniref:Uncharacterized protein n=1 Tax=Trichonephila clavipes TaxID=2585209 RepID=A0A8X6RYM9_TRICX|nr:hypothetical protein TNCV_4414101 [Trichonephila clavipes]
MASYSQRYTTDREDHPIPHMAGEHCRVSTAEITVFFDTRVTQLTVTNQSDETLEIFGERNGDVLCSQNEAVSVLVPMMARSPILSPIEHREDIIGRQRQCHPQSELSNPMLTDQEQQVVIPSHKLISGLSRHRGTLNSRKSSREMGGKGREVGDPGNPQGVFSLKILEPNRTITCRVLKATDNGKHKCRNEFHGA